MTRTYTFENPHRVVLGRDVSKGGSKQRQAEQHGASKATRRGAGGTAGQTSGTPASIYSSRKNKKDICIFAHEGGV